MRLRGLALVFFILTSSGCRTEDRFARVPQPPPAAIGTLRLHAPLAPGTDLASLSGRRITLDPGHGGEHPGAVGKTGVTEAELNLAVALHLFGLLVHAGAEVTMTRYADASLPDASGGAQSLKAELASRARTMPDGCDLFVSIHHNASPPRSKETDDTAIYYRLLDAEEPSASLEAAKCVQDSLAGVFAPASSRAVPGNYLVLREADAPAILGEAFYLELREAQLTQVRALRLEAECYFTGIASYFSRGVPKVVGCALGDDAASSVRPAVRCDLDAECPEGMDLSSLRAEIDGHEVPGEAMIVPDVLARRIQIVLRPGVDLANGAHELRVHGRNRRGAALYPRRLAFDIRRPASNIHLSHEPPCWIPGTTTRGSLHAVARVTDAAGQPVADGTEVLFRAQGAASPEITSETSGGIAEAEFSFRVSPPPGGHVSARTGSLEQRVAVPQGLSGSAFASGTLRNAFSREPISGAAVALEGSAAPTSRSYRSGRYSVGPVTTSTTARAEAPGFLGESFSISVSSTGMLARDITMFPLAGGALRDRRITVDAGKSSAESSRLATALAARLALLGAEARVSNGNDAIKKIRAATVWKCDAYLRLSREGGPRFVRVLVYPGATEGTLLAKAVGAAFSDAGIPHLQSAEADAVLLQMPCAAVKLFVHGAAASEIESDEEADRIALGLAEYLGADRRFLSAIAGAAGPPGDLRHTANDGYGLFLDGLFPIPLRADWTYRADLLPPGDRRLVLRHGAEAASDLPLTLTPGSHLERQDFGGAISAPPTPGATAIPTPATGGCLLGLFSRSR